MCKYITHQKINRTQTHTNRSQSARLLLWCSKQYTGEQNTYLSKYSWQVQIKDAGCNYSQGL